MEDIKKEVEEVEEPEIEPEIVNTPEITNEEFSESIGNLAGALAKAQGMMSNGKKEKEGFNYKYMELSTVMDIARKPLSDNGLAVTQSHQLVRRSDGPPSVVTRTTVMHESGEWYKSSIDLPVVVTKSNSPVQSVGVSASYGRRYALQAIFMIAGEEDTDGK